MTKEQFDQYAMAQMILLQGEEVRCIDQIIMLASKIEDCRIATDKCRDLRSTVLEIEPELPDYLGYKLEITEFMNKLDLLSGR